MSSSTVAFRKALHAEHLDEIGFLHNQCRSIRGDSRRPWQAPAPFEARLEAHLDALVVGGALAWHMCLELLPQAEPDVLFGIAALACRRADPVAIRLVLQGPAIDDPAKRAAVGAALVQEWPDAWRAQALHALAQGDVRLAPSWACLAVVRRWDGGDSLLVALERSASEAQPVLLAFLGRLGDEHSAWLVEACREGAPQQLRVAALRAALRLHDEGARSCALSQRNDPTLLALVGGPDSTARLLEQLQGAESPASLVEALGLLGDPSAVRSLIALLDCKPVASFAAQALNLITGAGLTEVVLEPELVVEEELNSEELRLWREQGLSPRRSDGTSFGPRVERLSQDPGAWSKWIKAHGANFGAGCRFRLGQRSSAEVALRGIAHPSLPATARAVLVDELQIRHGIVLPWHPDMPVTAQLRALRGAAMAAREANGRPGQWHWGGRPLL